MKGRLVLEWEIMMSLKDVLAIPKVYQAFQEAGGFYGARLAAIQKYLKPRAGQKIIDIGCGPGYMARDLPPGVDYLGFDIDERYIAFANRTFGERGKFFCRFFDEAVAETFGPADIVMMNGVLHHISDADVAISLRAIHKVLRPGGELFTLDCAYIEAQPWFARFMADHDRGRFVRSPDQYVRLLGNMFSTVEPHVRGDLARVPCTLFIAVSRKEQAAAMSVANAGAG